MSGPMWRLGHHVDAWQRPHPVGMPLADLTTHAVIVGMTGSGKSTLLRSLALQFYGAGGKVVVIEPHGDLIAHPREGILAALSPAHLPGVTVLDLASASPPQINLAAAGLPWGRDVAVQTAMRTLRTLEPTSWDGAVRMREILSNSLHLLLDVEGEQASLLALLRFLTDEPSRTRIREQVSEAVGPMSAWWKRREAQWHQDGRRETLADILEIPERRVQAVLQSDAFRHALALPALAPQQALDLPALLNDPHPRLLLVPLRRDLLGSEGVRVFGTLLLQMVAQTLLGRAALLLDERRPTLVIIDEFASLAEGEMGEVVGTLLAQGRKFGAGMVLGTQFLAQLPREVLTEVQGNTMTKVVLRLASEADARHALSGLGVVEQELLPSEVMSVERFYGYARTAIDGAPAKPFYFRTLPPDEVEVPDPAHPLALPEPPPLTRAQAVMLKQLHQAQAQGAEATVKKLVALGEGGLREAAAAQVVANQHLAQRLLQEARTGDVVATALQVSALLHGLPRPFYEAQYRVLASRKGVA